MVPARERGCQSCGPGRTVFRMKGQNVRLADVFFVGPVMIAGAMVVSRTGRSGLAAVLGALGVATIAYNAKNYSERLDQARARQEAGDGTST